MCARSWEALSDSVVVGPAAAVMSAERGKFEEKLSSDQQML